MENTYDFKIVYILAIGFAFASFLGYIFRRFNLSPIIGYLIAGYLIGPYSPGYSANLPVSEQLSEIGIILMMFGVGLHLDWRDLINLRRIAIPGAIFQTLFTAIFVTLYLTSLGWDLDDGIIMGIAVSVASTAVFVRIFLDNHLIHSPQGHLGMSWLIVEDLLTVIALVLLPTLKQPIVFEKSYFLNIGYSISSVLLKFAILFGILLTWGHKIVFYLLSKVSKTNSTELFTLTVLSIVFGIACGSAYLFGTSIALGAFVAGMVVGQTEVRQEADAGSLPIKDAFVVLFFVTIGMLFNPTTVVENFSVFLSLLAIIVILKPLIALLIMIFFKYPLRLAIGIAVALGQIGEFSFILTAEAAKLDILPDTGYDIIVACAIVSIALNPLLFHFFHNKFGHHKEHVV